jgi:hypothetical protein
MRSRGEVSLGSRHAVVAGVAVAVALVALALLFALGLWLWGPIGSAANSSEEPAAGSGSDAVATSAPVFATDEEALAAATEAYARYLAVSDAIAEDGGSDAYRIASVVSDEFLDASLEEFSWFLDRRAQMVGGTSFDSVSLQSRTTLPSGIENATIYVCLDVAGTRLIDDAGVDVTPPDRTLRLPLVVSFEFTSGGSQRSEVSSSVVWNGDNFC